MKCQNNGGLNYCRMTFNGTISEDLVIYSNMTGLVVYRKETIRNYASVNAL
jgi:hypothetical protein